jgi:hypothetical protein
MLAGSFVGRSIPGGGCMQPWQPLFVVRFRWLTATASLPALLFADALSIASSATALADALGISWVASCSSSILVCQAYLISIASFGCLCIVQMLFMVQHAMTIAQLISVCQVKKMAIWVSCHVIWLEFRHSRHLVLVVPSKFTGSAHDIT